jgi:hypothetical protein
MKKIQKQKKKDKVKKAAQAAFSTPTKGMNSLFDGFGL